MKRRVVVDASVARAAGERASEDPTSAQCREFLQTMEGHKAVFSRCIESEWKRHRSRYASRWLFRMRSHGRIVDVVPDPGHVSELAEAIQQHDGLTAKQRAAIEKDQHLPLAAWQADRLIASNDDAMRRLLKRLVGDVPRLGPVCWVDPTDDSECAVTWLAAGARDEPHRRLGCESE